MNLIKLKKELEISRKRNCNLNTSVEFLESQLTIAQKMYEKWSYGLKDLNYLSSTTNNRNKTGLGYTTQQECHFFSSVKIGR